MPGNRFPNTNTTRRGGKHDSRHRKARAAAARQHSPDDACARCGIPLGPMGPGLHYDHDDVNGGYLGFSHAQCNVVAGAQLGNQRQRQALQSTPRRSRTW